MLTAEQFVVSQKASLDTMFSLTATAFEGVEKLVDLNLKVARATITEAAAITSAALAVKDAQELMALQAGLLQPTAEKAAAYGRHVYDIASATGAEVGKVVEASAAEAQAKMMSAVDSAMKNAPVGSENAVAMMKSAVTTASNAFDSVQKVVKQASDAAESNLQALTATANKAAKLKRTV